MYIVLGNTQDNVHYLILTNEDRTDVASVRYTEKSDFTASKNLESILHLKICDA